jgi:hypothetical protein
MRIRVKFGKNPYSNRFTCSFCRREFEDGGFFLRVEYADVIVDVPICPTCFDSGVTFEGLVDLSAHNAAHPIGRA